MAHTFVTDFPPRSPKPVKLSLIDTGTGRIIVKAAPVENTFCYLGYFENGQFHLVRQRDLKAAGHCGLALDVGDIIKIEYIDKDTHHILSGK